jgi:glycosyltransferase involved in cell wall biosynthesis
VKVAFLNHETRMGGAEIMLLRFLKACDRSGIEPHVILPSSGEFAEELKGAGIDTMISPVDQTLLEVRRGRLFWDPMLALRLTRALRRLRREVAAVGAGVVVSNSLKAHVYGSLALAKGPIPYAWRLHDIIDRNTFGGIQYRFLTGLARRCPRSIAAVSRAVQSPLMEAGVDGRKLVIVHNGIDVNRFREQGRKSAFRKSFGIADGAFVITVPGRIMKSKGHAVMVEAMRSVRSSLPDAILLFAGAPFHGEPGIEHELREMVGRHGMAGSVLFLGFRKDMEAVYEASDVVVQPSLEPDAFPTVILEAMAAGCVVVASDIGGAREIITGGEDGFLVHPADPVAISERIIGIARQGPLRKVSDAARRTITGKFSEERYVREMAAWIEQVGGEETGSRALP